MKPSPFLRPSPMLLVFLVIAVAGCGADQTTTSPSTASDTPASGSPAASAEPVRRELLEPREGLYAEASRVGNLVWTAGHLPEDQPVTAPIEAQVREVLDDLEQTLENAGAGLETVVHANVYLTSFDDWEAFNTAFSLRMSRSGGGLPPRSTVAVSELGFGYKVEIEMVALVRDPSD